MDRSSEYSKRVEALRPVFGACTQRPSKAVLATVLSSLRSILLDALHLVVAPVLYRTERR